MIQQLIHKVRRPAIASLMADIRKRDPGMKFNALDIFAGSGEWLTQYYAPMCQSLTLWEIEAAHNSYLKMAFPKAAVYTVDSYERVKTESGKYNLIVIDNPIQQHGGHYEHFDLFPDIFRLCDAPASVIMNVILRLDKATINAFPNLNSKDHLAALRSFYWDIYPDYLSIDRLRLVYAAHAAVYGLSVNAIMTRHRSRGLYLLALRVVKSIV